MSLTRVKKLEASRRHLAFIEGLIATMDAHNKGRNFHTLQRAGGKHFHFALKALLRCCNDLRADIAKQEAAVRLAQSEAREQLSKGLSAVNQITKTNTPALRRGLASPATLESGRLRGAGVPGGLDGPSDLPLAADRDPGCANGAPSRDHRTDGVPNDLGEPRFHCDSCRPARDLQIAGRQPDFTEVPR